MRHKLSDVHPQPVLEQASALRNEVGGSAAIGVHKYGGNPLGQLRIGGAQLLRVEPGSQMRVHVDEPGRYV